MSKRRSQRRRTVIPSATPKMVMPTPGTSSPAALSEASLREEYRYVIADLKRIGITAISMFALLVVLALLLT